MCDFRWQGTGPVVKATLKAIFDGKNFLQETPEGELVGLVFDQTNFYAEAGGQLFDTGKVSLKLDRVSRTSIASLGLGGGNITSRFNMLASLDEMEWTESFEHSQGRL